MGTTPSRAAEPELLKRATYYRLWNDGLVSRNPLGFPGYVPPSAADESVATGVVEIDRARMVLVDCRFDHSGGTMGVVAGERIAHAFDAAVALRLPVAAFVSSGGARLQEGTVALTQMARTASAVLRHRNAGLLSAAVLRPHTTGGVYASWASLVDVRAGAPGATIGFGGPRVVAEMTGSLPPPSSHTAESAFRNGLLDALTPPADQWRWMVSTLVGPGAPLAPPAGSRTPPGPERVPTDGWEALLHARHPRRPSGAEWAAWLTDGWTELRGADPALRAGVATIDGGRVVVIAMDRHARGESAARQLPAGFQLARRALELADRLRLPVLTLIDTPGAEPGPRAEADGIAGEIARTLLAMAALRVPSVALCVGEGGSGGAMSFAHADRFLMLSGAVFPVISPTAGAAVLYRDPGRGPQLARNLGITAAELLALGVIDAIIDETAADVAARVRHTVTEAFRTAEVGDRDLRVEQLARRHTGRDAHPL